MENLLAVERETQITLRIALLSDLANAGIGFDRVHHPALRIEQFNFEVVKVGMGRGPKLRAGNFQFQFTRPFGGGNFLLSEPSRGTDFFAGICLAGELGRYRDGGGLDGGRQFRLGDIPRGNFLQPDGLPDAGNARVPDALGFEGLLAPQLRPARGVPGANDDFIRALF
jgi:hypothetical protein